MIKIPVYVFYLQYAEQTEQHCLHLYYTLSNNNNLEKQIRVVYSNIFDNLLNGQIYWKGPNPLKINLPNPFLRLILNLFLIPSSDQWETENIKFLVNEGLRINFHQLFPALLLVETWTSKVRTTISRENVKKLVLSIKQIKTRKKHWNNIKGSDRLWKVVELSMHCCGKFISDSFETY